MQCARHPKVETSLTCNRCGTPICPRCLVPGAVGMLCRSCADLGGSPLFKIRPERLVLALVAGIAAGTLAGVIFQQLGLWFFFAAPLIGGFLGNVVLWCTGHKRGKKAMALAGFSLLAGAALSTYLTGIWERYLVDPLSATLFAIAVAIAIGTALGKIRYL